MLIKAEFIRLEMQLIYSCYGKAESLEIIPYADLVLKKLTGPW